MKVSEEQYKYVAACVHTACAVAGLNNVVIDLTITPEPAKDCAASPPTRDEAAPHATCDTVKPQNVLHSGCIPETGLTVYSWFNDAGELRRGDFAIETLTDVKERVR